MKLQILNSFKGDDVKDINTSSEEGRGSAAKLIGDLLRTGSALFLEKSINGKMYTYRVTGYDQERDRVRLSLSMDDAVPEEAEMKPKKRGKYMTQSRRREAREALIASDVGQIVSVAPVSGGLDAVEEKTPALTWEGVRYAVNHLCEQRGWHHGCPMPSATDQSHELIVAKGAPLYSQQLAGRVSFQNTPKKMMCKAGDVDEDPERLVNRWTQDAVDVQVWRDSKGTFKLRWPLAHIRLRFVLDTIAVRTGAVDSDTELVAMLSLFEKISEMQRNSYILNDAFFERSKRSGVTYVLRKGRPTIALRVVELPEGKEQRNFLAALCLHPMAYYLDTWAGSQPPTDEVIAHLMLIRTDEHRFWKKAGQHSIDDPRAAI